jgi:serine/threonine protein kinase
VGIILFILFTGQHPFDAAPMGDMMANHLLTQPPEACEIDRAISRPLSDLIKACLGKVPDERPSATDLAKKLRAYADAVGAPELCSIEWRDTERRDAELHTAVEGKRRFDRASGV